jgi:hypothetical protein
MKRWGFLLISVGAAPIWLTGSAGVSAGNGGAPAASRAAGAGTGRSDQSQIQAARRFDLSEADRRRVIQTAEAYLKEAPVTVTASRSPRSAGGRHDFYSEGDYWWPDPANPAGPYIQRDGMSNPDNFVDHRRAMIRLSEHVSTLASAYFLTLDERFATHAMTHLRAWFTDEATRMNPNLLYAQAIYKKVTGRGTGLIDTIHLVEVARATERLATAKSTRPADIAAVKDWFSQYLVWLTTHQYGIDERDAKNNHGTCWVMQVAAFARLTGHTALLDDCRRRYKEVLLPGQMAADGSFPLEIKRTKPYGYSLFNLDAFATICQILSTPDASLWTFALPDGRGIRKGMAFLFPYMQNKAAWPFPKDVMYFDEWPVRHPSLLFAGLALSEGAYLDLWTSLNASPSSEEVIRNLPVRHPLLWLDLPPAGRY